mmetsp:Transcript_59000/g.71006  ORF Transcript_59000/g.71006 Transcript_59000/m.71006 type:complete len:143 (+) Transcript_59000:283-711(+)
MNQAKEMIHQSSFVAPSTPLPEDINSFSSLLTAAEISPILQNDLSKKRTCLKVLIIDDHNIVNANGRNLLLLSLPLILSRITFEEAALVDCLLFFCSSCRFMLKAVAGDIIYFGDISCDDGGGQYDGFARKLEYALLLLNVA